MTRVHAFSVSSKAEGAPETIRRRVRASASFTSRRCNESVLPDGLSVDVRSGESTVCEVAVPAATGASPEEAGTSPSVPDAGVFVEDKAVFTSDGDRGLIGAAAVAGGVLTPFLSERDAA